MTFKYRWKCKGSRTKAILKNMKTERLIHQILILNLKIWYVRQCGMTAKLVKWIENRMWETHT